MYTYQELLDNFQEISESRHIIEPEPEIESNVVEEESPQSPQSPQSQEDIKVLLTSFISSIEKLTEALNRQNLLQ